MQIIRFQEADWLSSIMEPHSSVYNVKEKPFGVLAESEQALSQEEESQNRAQYNYQVYKTSLKDNPEYNTQSSRLIWYLFVHKSSFLAHTAYPQIDRGKCDSLSL